MEKVLKSGGLTGTGLVQTWESWELDDGEALAGRGGARRGRSVGEPGAPDTLQNGRRHLARVTWERGLSGPPLGVTRQRGRLRRRRKKKNDGLRKWRQREPSHDWREERMGAWPFPIGQKPGRRALFCLGGNARLTLIGSDGTKSDWLLQPASTRRLAYWETKAGPGLSAL